MITQLIIEYRQRGSVGKWEAMAYPIDDAGEKSARMLLESLKESEKKKKYPNDLRLVRKTISVIST